MNGSEDTLEVDFERALIRRKRAGRLEVVGIGTPRGFELLSEAWLRSGWDAKYVYTFSWFGRPMIQLPEDMIRIQEVIYNLRPDLIIETGVAHGGSIAFYASLCKAMDHGHVLGIDIEIRPHNREAMESHELREYYDLIEGSSIHPAVLERVRKAAGDAGRVMVILDSNHSYSHVSAELEAYSPMVTIDSFIVVTDGIMKDIVGAPRSNADWKTNNPFAAAHDFLRKHSEFASDEPKWLFNESEGLSASITYWPGAWLRRIK